MSSGRSPWRPYLACGRKQLRVGIKRPGPPERPWAWQFKFIALEWQL